VVVLIANLKITIVNWNIEILQMFQEICSTNWKHFKEKSDYSYTCSKIPFSGNQELIDPVQVRGVERLEELPKHMPNRITIWKFIERIPFTPGQTTKKMHWMLQENGERKETDDSGVEICIENCLKILTRLSSLLSEHFSIFTLSFENSIHNNYHPKFVYFYFLSFSKYILCHTLSQRNINYR
jgi:hypothetical protein